MLGYTLVTKQSGKDGLPCNSIYIVEKIGIDRELYLSITLDRASAMVTFIYSKEGGMAIEDVAEATPEKVHRLNVDPLTGLDENMLDEVSVNLDLVEHKDQVNHLFKRLYACFWEKDCDMIEVNPLVLTTDKRVLCADSKVTIDSNALHRQKELASWEDLTQDNPKEAHAK